MLAWNWLSPASSGARQPIIGDASLPFLRMTNWTFSTAAVSMLPQIEKSTS